MTTKEEKARRMKIRKKIGNRELVAPRYDGPKGPEYLVAHACFKCRKSFKYPFNDEKVLSCPQCSGELAEMGRAFKAPKKNQVTQWKKVQKLRNSGYRFPTNTSEPAKYPDRVQDVDDFIITNPNHKFRLRKIW